MEQEVLEQWRVIYGLAQTIGSFLPWERFSEEDTFAYVPKGTQDLHFFTFLSDSCGQYGIAIYPDDLSYCAALHRLHGKNPKREPAFALQNGIILLWGDRENVSKGNYALIRELGMKFRGRGAWLHFEKYREGYVPDMVPEADLAQLKDDLGNLRMMLRAVYEQGLQTYFDQGKTMLRFYSEEVKLYVNDTDAPKYPRKVEYPQLSVQMNEPLQALQALHSRGTIAMDWSYLPKYIEEDEKVFPRLLLAVEPDSGMVLSCRLLPPAAAPYIALFEMIDRISQTIAKPAQLQICDREMEAYLTDFCQKVGIRLVMKKSIKAITQARKEIMERI